MHPPEYISYANLDGSHRDGLHRAIGNALISDITLDTYAQILDGLPYLQDCLGSVPQLA